jgi:hypothetical protein
MGRLLTGINGPIYGKVGSVIGSSRNGVPYIKGLYKKRTLKVSEKELANRQKFAAAQAWLRPRTKGNNYHVYAAFSAADRSRQSESIYLGEWKT